MPSERTPGPRLLDSGTWYLAQAADGVWRIHARAGTHMASMRFVAELLRYPAVLTSNGNLFHLGTPPEKAATQRLS